MAHARYLRKRFEEILIPLSRFTVLLMGRRRDAFFTFLLAHVESYQSSVASRAIVLSWAPNIRTRALVFFQRAHLVSPYKTNYGVMPIAADTPSSYLWQLLCVLFLEIWFVAYGGRRLKFKRGIERITPIGVLFWNNQPVDWWNVQI